MRNIEDIFERSPVDEQDLQNILVGATTTTLAPKVLDLTPAKTTVTQPADIVSAMRDVGMQETSGATFLPGANLLASPDTRQTNTIQTAIIDASKSLDPEFFLSTPTGQAAAEGEQSSYMPYLYNTDEPGPARTIAGEFGGIPVRRVTENEFHVDVPVGLNKVNRSVYDAKGNLIAQKVVDTSGGLIGKAFPAITQAALVAMGIPPEAAAAIVARTQGADIEGMIKSAGLTYAGSVAGKALSGLGGDVSKYVTKEISPYLPEGGVGDIISNTAASAAKNVTTEVGKAFIGSALTGSPLDLTNAITAGAFSGLAQGTMDTISDAMGKDSLISTFPKPLKDAAFAAIAAELRGQNPGAAAINMLIKQIGASISRAAKETLTQPSTRGGGDFGTQSIFEGTEGGGGGIESVVIPLATTGEEDLVDILSQPSKEIVGATSTTITTKSPEQVLISGSTLYDTSAQDLLDLLNTPLITNVKTPIIRKEAEPVVVAGSTIPPEVIDDLITTSVTPITNQQVGVTASKTTTAEPVVLDELIPEATKQTVPVTGLNTTTTTEAPITFDETIPEVTKQTVPVTGLNTTTTTAAPITFDETIPEATKQTVPVTGLNTTTTTAAPITFDETITTSTTQKVEITERKTTTTTLPPDVIGSTSTTLPATTTTTTTTAKPSTTGKPSSGGVKTTTPAPRMSAPFAPIPEQGVAPSAARPGVVEGAYEVLFGPNAPSMMGFTKAERLKQLQELVAGEQEEENQPRNVYERLMAMADSNPVGTVNELMNIIKGNSNA